MATRRQGIIVKIIPATKGHWEIFASHSHKRKKKVRFTSVNDVKHYGVFEFGTRLIAKNGNLLCCNPIQFNNLRSAMTNIKAVKASA